MRNAFARGITQLAAADRRIVLLSGDIGNRLFDNYKNCCGERFFNCGVAEANMAGVAAGLAMCGMRPVMYTIASFATARCFEQIRIDIAYHGLPVIITGVGGGLSYAENGATHHSCDDIALMRGLPGMTVVCPGDALEVEALLPKLLELPGPSYLRLGKKGEPLVHKALPPVEIGRAFRVMEGKEAILLSVGNMLPVAAEAAGLLRASGIDAGVLSMHTVKPLDEETLADIFSSARVVATVEEHSVIGGAGAAVAQWLASRGGSKARLLNFAVPDIYTHTAGKQRYARESFGLTPAAICAGIAKAIA